MIIKGKYIVINTSTKSAYISKNMPIAKILKIQGYKVNKVNCFKPISGVKSICENAINYPPLITTNKMVPSLIYYVRGRIVPGEKSSASITLPWGTMVRYVIPVIWGFLRAVCDVYADVVDGVFVVTIDCPGVPAPSFIRPVIRAVKRAQRDGHEIRLNIIRRKLYTLGTVNRIANYIYRESLKRVLRLPIFPYGLSHVVLAAIYRVMEMYGVEPNVRLVPVGFRADLSDPERNRFKTAIDWACSEGDEVACMAHHIIHRDMFLRFFEENI
jgi:hypothetical protein